MPILYACRAVELSSPTSSSPTATSFVTPASVARCRPPITTGCSSLSARTVFRACVSMEGLRGDTIRPACARDEKALDDLELVRVQDVEANALLEQEEIFAQRLE